MTKHTTSRYLIVGNQTLGGEHLAEQVWDRASRGLSSFHLVVSATPPSHYLVWTEGEATMLARRRLERGLSQLRKLGVDVTGEVGDANPLDAIGDALAGQSFDEIVLFILRPACPAGCTRTSPTASPAGSPCRSPTWWLPSSRSSQSKRSGFARPGEVMAVSPSVEMRRWRGFPCKPGPPAWPS